MKKLVISGSILATSTLTVGLSVLNVNAAYGVTITTTATADTYIDSRSPNASFGTQPILILGEDPAPPAKQKIFLKFGNLAPLSPGQLAVNVRATLTLKGLDTVVDVSSAGGFALRNGVNWTDTSNITYNNANAWIDPTTALFTGAVAASPAITSFTGTGLNNLAQAWLNGNVNYGLAIDALTTKANPAGRFDRFASREDTSSPALIDPTLTVTYDILQAMPWQIQGRAGGRNTWEVALQNLGSNTPLRDSQGASLERNLNWQNGVPLDWNLLWNRDTNLLTFTIAGQTLQYTYPEPIPNQPTRDFLQGLRLSTRSLTDETPNSCRVSDGTGISLKATQYRQTTSTRFSNLPTTWVSESISPDTAVFDFFNNQRLNDLNRNLTGLLSPIAEFKGTATISWDPTSNGCNPSGSNSEVQFFLQGLTSLPLNATVPAAQAAFADFAVSAEEAALADFTVPQNSTALADTLESQSVPEPVSGISLLGLGLLGVGRRYLKRFLSQNSQ